MRYHTLHAYIPPHPAVETMSAPKREKQKTKGQRQKEKAQSRKMPFYLL